MSKLRAFLRREAGRDLLVATALFGLLLALLIEIDFVELLFEYTRAHEELELDEFFALLPAIALGAAWFAYRRWRESRALAERLSDSVGALRLSNERLARAKAEAEQASRAKSEFLAVMSHEIRTPLNGVIPMTELLLQSGLTPLQARYAETVRDSGRGLLVLIDDILDMAKLETGRMELEEAPLAIGPLVEGSVALFAAPAAEKGLEVSMFVDPALPTRLNGDAARLRQVLLNLIGNAVKFTDRGAVSVEVGGALQSDRAVLVRFDVRDSGIGIAEADQARIFESFSQADASVTRRFGGTGLGLSICRRLVEAMGGEIGVESRPGEGSHFWFTVRLARAASAVSEPAALRLDGRRVLVVDDLALNRMILSRQIAAWGAEVDSVETGPDALARLRAAAEQGRPYHLAVLDHMMPEMDGVTLAERLRDDPVLAATPLLLASSGLLPDPKTRAALPNLIACVSKPVGQDKLKACLSEIAAARTSEAGHPSAGCAGTASSGD